MDPNIVQQHDFWFDLIQWLITNQALSGLIFGFLANTIVKYIPHFGGSKDGIQLAIQGLIKLLQKVDEALGKSDAVSVPRARDAGEPVQPYPQQQTLVPSDPPPTQPEAENSMGRNGDQ